MKQRPLVSVYLPTRNRAASLERAIRSVLQQDYPRFELLVVDDGSTDDTPALLARFAGDDPRVRPFRNDAPRGASAARNVAIREARGEFVTGIDDDDQMLSGRLTSLLDAWCDRHSFVCSAFYVVNVRERWFQVRGRSEGEISLAQLLTRNVVGNQALMHIDRLRAVGAFDESQPAWQDYDLWTRMVIDYGPALQIAEPTYVFFESLDPRRITYSGVAIDGARRYMERYRRHMGPGEIKGQRLMQIAVQRQRLRMADALACMGATTWRQVAGYWARTNVPGFATMVPAYYRWRRPLARLSAQLGRQVSLE